MLQLNPAETYVVNRILKDWADPTTYYVQAKVYDAGNRAVLETLNLTDNGSRWYSKSYRVPDTGQTRDGRRLIVITSVFTDSGYSVRSNNHYDEVEEILVLQHLDASVAFGGGGGFDYDTIARLFKTILEEALKPKELAEGEVAEVEEPIELKITRCMEAFASKLLAPLAEIKGAVDVLPKEFKQEKVDLAGVLEMLDHTARMVAAIPTKHEKVDLDSVVDKFGKGLRALEAAIKAEISGQGKKDLVLSFMDNDEVAKDKRRRGLVAIAKKHGIKI